MRTIVIVDASREPRLQGYENKMLEVINVHYTDEDNYLRRGPCVTLNAGTPDVCFVPLIHVSYVEARFVPGNIVTLKSKPVNILKVARIGWDTDFKFFVAYLEGEESLIVPQQWLTYPVFEVHKSNGHYLISGLTVAIRETEVSYLCVNRFPEEDDDPRVQFIPKELCVHRPGEMLDWAQV